MTSDLVQLRCFDSFSAVRADAGGRLDNAAQPSPFDRLDWFERLHRHGFSGYAPVVVRAQQGACWVWLFLIATPDGRLGSLANWYSFVFRPQFHGCADRADRLTLLRAIAEELRGTYRQITLHPVVEDEVGDADLIEEAFGAGGWGVVTRTLSHKRCIAIAPGTSFADYWAARAGPLRSTLRRKAQRHPLEISLHHTLDDPLWATLEAVFGASWKPEGENFRFLREFAQAEAQAGRLRLGLASQDGAPAAVELWTIDQGRAYIHKLAFDERFADASPGTQLSHAMFRQAIDVDTVSLIDFGTGDNAYKADWMPQAVPMRQIDAFDLRRPASWPLALRSWVSALSQPGENDRKTAGANGGRRAVAGVARRNRD